MVWGLRPVVEAAIGHINGEVRDRPEIETMTDEVGKIVHLDRHISIQVTAHDDVFSLIILFWGNKRLNRHHVAAFRDLVDHRLFRQSHLDVDVSQRLLVSRGLVQALAARSLRAS